MRHGAARAVALTIALASAGCADQPELHFADWVFPVPEGVPIKEYAPVPPEARTEIAFELVEDLVIGGDPSDPNTAFYQPTAIVAAENGNIFVVENGGKRVQMFAPDGAFLKTLGKEGQGPGEFQMPMSATVAGEHLIVFDMMARRFSVWTDAGEHVADHALQLTSIPSRLAGLSDGRIVAVATEIDLSSMDAAAVMTTGMPATTTVLASYTTQFEQLERLLELTDPPMPSPIDMMNNTRARTQSMITRGAAPRLAFAVASGRAVYVTPSSEYQILAMTPEGETNWALRVALDRRPFPQDSKERRVRLLARDDPEISADDFEWPEFDDAISGTIRSDGQGRLYVYPIFARPPAEEPAQEEGAAESEDAGEPPQGRPVDVYSPEGDLIVAGRASGSWTYARGDYVYRFRRDPDTDETLVVRLRLVLRPESVSGG